MIGTPPRIPCKAPCEDVKCGSHAYCKPEGQEAYCICEDGWTFDPADISAGCIDINECDESHGPSGLCGLGAKCQNRDGAFDCSCDSGFSGDPFKQCLDVNECSNPNTCGENALCNNNAGSYECSCPEGTIADPDPSVRCIAVVTCKTEQDCPGNAICDEFKRCLCPEPNVGNDCRHPCENVNCGPNSECLLVGGQAKCLCQSGYTDLSGVCVDINECLEKPCGPNAVCNNLPGKYVCQCPSGSTGEAYNTGCSELSRNIQCNDKNPCPSGEKCVTDAYSGNNVCVCGQGYIRDENEKCRDVNECTESEKPSCGVNAICKNLPGSYECQCPTGFNGNPFHSCEECNSAECQCQPPYQLVGGNCILAGCSNGKKCPKGAECISITGGVSYCACPKGYRTQTDGTCTDINECIESSHACGYDAICINTDGAFECECPKGYNGDPYLGLCSAPQRRCAADKECGSNEKCVQPGECICPPPFFVDASDGNQCKSPCERFACGINAKCSPTDPPQCMCEAGFKGDPLLGCISTDECANAPCAYGAQCVNQKGGYKCVCPNKMSGDPYKSGCVILDPILGKSECTTNQDCASNLHCNDNTCISPCTDLLCGPNAFCEPENHAGWCRCRVGFSEGPNGDCVSRKFNFINLFPYHFLNDSFVILECEGYRCGQGALCIVTSEGPTCKCPTGQLGNPFAGGSCVVDQCSAQRPCQSPQVCINGRCKQKCDGVVCGVGATCDSGTGRCVCEPFFVGNPDYICMPPVAPPACTPACGTNAHCQYGGAYNNVCVCNIGNTGNPYEGCGVQNKITCSKTTCGAGAECREGLNAIECICPAGFVGNPYVSCVDANECSTDVCGDNAICINTPGSYDCKCKQNHAGNPFVMCSPISKGLCDDPNKCKCSNDVLCPFGFKCDKGKCKDLCSNIACGPRAACDTGKCVCPPGHTGNAFDAKTGCTLIGQCQTDVDCKNSEICFQIGRGLRKCVDGCSKSQCGPNALCVTNDHRSTCICAEGFNGNPRDLQRGCHQEQREVPPSGCKSNVDCEAGEICEETTRNCVNPCNSVACGKNEVCKLDGNNAVCHCQDSFVWNPVSSSCDKPSIPECSNNEECHQSSACIPDVLGVLKCVPVCSQFNCPANSVCNANNHEGSCQCLPGYSGNPNDRNGCRIERQNECSTNAECPESDMCLKQQGAFKCVSACDKVQCGPAAVCITNNHIAQCTCPPGSFAGDPNDLSKGCQEVPCVYNIDCPPTQLCNRLTHTCYDVCQEDTCGDNAVCIAEDHKSNCQCPAGFRPNPIADVECAPIETCNANVCHPTAICEVGSSGPVCKCPPNYIGDAYSAGCRIQVEGDCPRGDIDCPLDAVCNSGKCINPCENACGKNALCSVIERKPVCTCPGRFAPLSGNAQDGCVRELVGCNSDIDCGGGVCQNSQCKVVCRQSGDCSAGEKCIQNSCVLPCSGNSQCANGQACVNGACILGCRGNKDCAGSEACVNSKCQNPCDNAGVCGPNAICDCQNHLTSCKCPPGFEGNPTPDQGCVRVPAVCSLTSECPLNHMCIARKCNLPCTDTNACAIGERCFNSQCSKVCYTNNNCLPGEICNEGGICIPGCSSDVDCPNTQVCLQAKCKCGKGFIDTPFGCTDIDECTEQICHTSAVCENTQGSYKCICPQNTVGDAYAEPGCRKPSECYKNDDCADNLSCANGKCIDPCSLKTCGPNAQCHVNEHEAECHCPQGHLGNPEDKSIGCFRVECLNDDECPLDKSCDLDSNKCLNPCDYISCGKGSCQIVDHGAVCACFTGYTLINNKCEDIDECLQEPCHESAICKNAPGNFICTCPEGLVGDPIRGGCRKAGECFSDVDCPDSAVCENSKCKNPCESTNVCGTDAICRTASHTVTCRCPQNTKGDPKVACQRIECSDNNECAASKSCVNSKCVDPCSLPNACGQNANCITDNHVGVCSCLPGTTGNPLLGCVQIQYCSADNQCPSGTKCNNGICCALCSSSRDCLTDQLCIQSVCQPTCKTNSTCPDFQFCLNNICVQETKCNIDDDCDIGEHCVIDTNGRSECKNVCSGRFLCGRNADCIARNHNPECECKPGFSSDGKTCKKIECQVDTDCSNDKKCEGNMCKIVCLMGEPCGENALCSSENHKQDCHCQPGFTGDPKVKCTLIDFCKESPCGPGASCKNSRGSFRCFCKAGMVGDAFKSGCQKAVECQINDDCPKAAKCVQENGVPKCRDVCENVNCGPNAECQAENHAAFCGCRSGYDGNPKDLVNGCKPIPSPCQTNSDCLADSYCNNRICKPACVLSTECGTLEACVSGQCVDPCDLPQACGMNAECQTSKHIKQCSCPAGFTGSSDVECVRVPIACASNSDCSQGKSCTDTMCLPTCLSDQDCALNEKCLSGNCMLTCRVDNDCFLGHICLHNKCVFGCHSDEDCSGSETCANNKCTNPCEQNPCGPNAICTVSNQRASCSCTQGMVPSPTAKVACIRSPALPCAENRDCSVGAACFNDFCRPVCANDAGCLNNERCDSGACKPLCRKDDDCRNGEVCQGLVCVIGCRSNTGCADDLACVNQQCTSPCLEPTACGTNAVCSVANHQTQCACLEPLVGNPLESCKYPAKACEKHDDCSTGQTCYGKVCRSSCRNDQNCLSDERCIRGTCRTICNTDNLCGQGFICENRICQIGCRTDNTCPSEQACINKQCSNPCAQGQCGSCAQCNVFNHGVQCSCPAGLLGDALVSCTAPIETCNSNCKCDESGLFCMTKCRTATDCACGQVCNRGSCRAKCNPGNCAPGQLCQGNVCLDGCRTNSDCANDLSCISGKCKNPCEKNNCGERALCRVSDHRALCICPDGFTGEPTIKCTSFECQTNDDCDVEKRCESGTCKNPCLKSGVCGINAQCRVDNRQATCLCLPNFTGNPKVKCDEPKAVSCQRNTCGMNSYCTETANGPECKCQTGCIGDPIQGCTCEGSKMDSCADKVCGINAACKVDRSGRPSCYCPKQYPNGDANTECMFYDYLTYFNSCSNDFSFVYRLTI